MAYGSRFQDWDLGLAVRISDFGPTGDPLLLRPLGLEMLRLPQDRRRVRLMRVGILEDLYLRSINNVYWEKGAWGPAWLLRT